MFCSEFAYVLRLSVSMRKDAGEHPFCILIYINSYIFHICFILFILLSYLIFDLECLTLSLADTHRIAKTTQGAIYEAARSFFRAMHSVYLISVNSKTALARSPQTVLGYVGKKGWGVEGY